MYGQFVLSLTERELLYPHFELISCVSSIDEVYHLIYDCFVEDYGIVNFERYPTLRRKFSPVLFTLFLDSYNKNGVVRRKYSEEGKRIALLEKAIHSKVYFTESTSSTRQCVYYKDFLLKLITGGDVSILAFDRVMARGKNTLLKGQLNAEIDDRVMSFFRVIYNGNPELPDDVNEIRTYKFLFSTIGIYNCITHLSECDNVHDLIPKLHTKIMSEKDSSQQNFSPQSIITIIILVLAVIGLISMCE